jgi:tRNA pseudouridine55 synthase
MPQHGWLNLNKPEGMTSAKAVSIVKRLLNVKKVGHTGTLDPLACGVLPLAIGEATKLSQYVMADQKAYRFMVEWGKATTTDDREGEVIAESDNRPTLEQIKAILPRFIGEIMQVPPDFSAIKVAGERSYKKAREGKKVELPARPVRVHSLEVSSTYDDEKLETTTFTVTCGKGTYVRSLARDMGEVLRCYGYVTFLQRTEVGFFSLKDAITLDLKEENRYALGSDQVLQPLDGPLDDILAVRFTPDQMHRLMQGQMATSLNLEPAIREAKVLRCYDAKSGNFFALGKPVGSLIKPVRVFNLAGG